MAKTNTEIMKEFEIGTIVRTTGLSDSSRQNMIGTVVGYNRDSSTFQVRVLFKGFRTGHDCGGMLGGDDSTSGLTLPAENLEVLVKNKSIPSLPISKPIMVQQKPNKYIIVWNTSCGDPHILCPDIPAVKRELIKLYDNTNVIKTSIQVYELKKKCTKIERPVNLYWKMVGARR